MNEVACPKCGSTQISANKKGFSGKKAVAGAILTGGIGIAAGTLGSNKIIITCLACAHKFSPGEGTTSAKFNNETNEQSPISETDQSILRLIKEKGMLSAVKFYNELSGKGLLESKNYIDNLALLHSAKQENSKGGCAGVFLFLLAVLLSIWGLM